jgi:hypothetical protein
MPSNSSGVFIIRAWSEEGSSEPLRAHIRVTTDSAKGMQHELTLTEIDGVSALVTAWLVDVMSGN